MTGDEKYVLYSNFTRKRQWLLPDENPLLTAKGRLHPPLAVAKCSFTNGGISGV